MFLDLSGLDLPATSEQLFGRPGRLAVEIGFGDGWFLSHLARQHPDWNLVGADLSPGSVSRAFRRMRREAVRNVRLFRGNAQFVLRNVIPPRALHRVYVNYPDPWPKKRHRKKRLLHASFLHMLSTRLEPGGLVLFTTDHAQHYASVLETAEKTGLFAVTEATPPVAMLRTKYARKWHARDFEIWHARIKKTGEAQGSFPPNVTRLRAMHHALLTGTLPESDEFESFVHRFKGGQVIFLDAMRSVGAPGLVFAARIEEEDLTQDVLIEARPARKAHADVIVRVTRFGVPLPTLGTREAARAMAQWLASRGMTVLETYY